MLGSFSYAESSERVETGCTGGLIFRASISNYAGGKGISLHHKESLTLLKRASCKCLMCACVLDMLNTVSCDINDFEWKYIVPIDGLKDKQKYMLVVDSFDEDEFDTHFELLD